MPLENSSIATSYQRKFHIKNAQSHDTYSINALHHCTMLFGLSKLTLVKLPAVINPFLHPLALYNVFSLRPTHQLKCHAYIAACSNFPITNHPHNIPPIAFFNPDSAHSLIHLHTTLSTYIRLHGISELSSSF